MGGRKGGDVTKKTHGTCPKCGRPAIKPVSNYRNGDRMFAHAAKERNLLGLPVVEITEHCYIKGKAA
jgi:hypothetical protein